jgi:hypothetical protein
MRMKITCIHIRARIAFFSVLALALVRLQSASPQEVPFQASSENQAISAVPDGDGYLFVTTLGAGNASHLGKFTFVSPHRAGLLDFSVEGAQIFTAANGDELQGWLSGNLTPFVDETGHFYLIGDVSGTITGGTGRFSDATGTYTFSVVFDTETASSTSMISGSINYGGR